MLASAVPDFIASSFGLVFAALSTVSSCLIAVAAESSSGNVLLGSTPAACNIVDAKGFGFS
jgi:hypothetical protein